VRAAVRPERHNRSPHRNPLCTGGAYKDADGLLKLNRVNEPALGRNVYRGSWVVCSNPDCEPLNVPARAIVTVGTTTGTLVARSQDDKVAYWSSFRSTTRRAATEPSQTTTRISRRLTDGAVAASATAVVLDSRTRAARQPRSERR
jgi:hypothetical protein